MSGPRISVIMPALNGERYLGAAVTSILAQSEPQFEFIIIDDGSNDATPDLARDFAARDERIRFFCDGVRRGVASRLNQGLALASSDFIARMDA
ncbi:MAG TPA: glycosyltransferase family A protein, partial [Parvularculaceae bacterium]|nr:glycosyltransferase family A protein [Parvularculaceae bacterium]